MLSAQHIATIKSTIPLLEDVGNRLTQHFYQRLFQHNPELKHVFNMSHQHSGHQSVALFNAIAAYARHIDDVGALKAAVERIAQKHTSFNIQPAHYAIVGHHLIETLRELAGPAFSPEVESAWTAAYQQLAGVFIEREGILYYSRSAEPGGWTGPRRFKLVEKRVESDLVKSLVFAPVDGGKVIDYRPGQYLGIRVQPPQHEFMEIRQYSLSDKPNGETYRISVKRETVGVPGVVSNYLHDGLQLGDQLELFAPAGDFFFVDHQSPVTLISAGVGLTPMQAILEQLAESQYPQPVHYLHACNNFEQHSFRVRNVELAERLNLQIQTWYRDEPLDQPNTHHGLLNLEMLKHQLPLLTGHFYLCGPVAFMRHAKQQLLALGVSDQRVHYEVFGPHQAL